MKHVILVDLDVLLDTRVGTLMRINPDETIQMLRKGFCHRKSDDISNLSNVITTREFKEAYAKRDADTLKEARLTNYIFELKEVVRQITEGIIEDNSRIDEGLIVINYYPYKELDAETLDDIVYAIQQYVTESVDIQVAYYEPHELDLKRLKESEILTYIVYDFKNWFESVFSEAKGRDSIISYPKLTIVAPQIMPKLSTFDKLDMESKKLLQNKTPFDFLKMYWSPMFGLEFCPIELMSLVDTSII